MQHPSRAASVTAHRPAEHFPYFLKEFCQPFHMVSLLQTMLSAYESNFEFHQTWGARLYPSRNSAEQTVTVSSGRTVDAATSRPDFKLATRLPSSGLPRIQSYTARPTLFSVRFYIKVCLDKMETIKCTCGGSNWSHLVYGCGWPL